MRWISGIVWVGLLGCALSAQAQKESTSFVGKQSSGNLLRVRQVTFGTNILNVSESGEITLVDPQQLGKRFRPENRLQVWVSVSPERDKPKFTRWILGFSGQYFPSGSSTRRTIGKRTEYGVTFETFPRRDRVLIFTGTVDGERFTTLIPNPIPATTEFPSLVLNRQKSSEFEIKINRVRIGKWTRRGIKVDTATPSFSVMRRGIDLTHWFGIQFRFEDATGNRRGTPPLDEDRWKLKVRLFKNEKAEWRPEEYIAIKPDQLPGPGEMQVHEINRNLNGRRIDTLFLAGPGNFVISNNIVLVKEKWSADDEGNGGGETDEGHAFYEYSVRDKLWALLVWDGKTVRFDWLDPLMMFAADQAGRNVPVMAVDGVGGLNSRATRYRLEPPASLKTFELRIPSQKPIETEFLIDPKNPPNELPPAPVSHRFAVTFPDGESVSISRIALGMHGLIYINDQGEPIRLRGSMYDERFAGLPNTLTIFVKRSRGVRDISYQWRTETGQRFVSVGPSGSHFVDGQHYDMIPLEVFPRHLPEFKLEGHADKQPFSFTIPNPLHRFNQIKRLKAATIKTNGLEFRLSSFELGEMNEQLYAMARVGAFRDDKPVGGIAAETVFSDGYGNRGRMIPTNTWEWKVETTLHKSSGYAWPEGSYVSVEPGPVPDAAKVKIQEVQHEIEGINIDRVVIGGPGSFVISNGNTLSAESPPGKWRGSFTMNGRKSWRIADTFRQSWVLVFSRGAERKQKLVAFARNPDGSSVPLKTRGGGGGAEGGYQFHRYYLPEPQKVKEGWTISFATSLPMKAEFVVDIRPSLRKLEEQRRQQAQQRAAMEAYRRRKAQQEKKQDPR